jgi:hypothetical protein
VSPSDRVPPPARTIDPSAEAPGSELLPPAGASLVSSGDLLERRQRLAEQLAELTWDLGGLTYEMAIRDHFRNDVLVRRAAKLQQVDGELAEVERLLRMETAGASGACPGCGALHSRGAVFCWQCGHQLLPTTSEFHPVRA